MQTLHTSTLGLISRRNSLKYLTLHSPFCILFEKNTPTELPSCALWNLLVLWNHQMGFKMGLSNIKNAKPTVGYSQVCYLCRTHLCALNQVFCFCFFLCYTVAVCDCVFLLYDFFLLLLSTLQSLISPTWLDRFWPDLVTSTGWPSHLCDMTRLSQRSRRGHRGQKGNFH